jgi:SOS-response transcriptional repressor LexA
MSFPVYLQVLSYLLQHAERHGWMPSNRELRHHFGWASTNAVQCHLVALEKHGFLIREPRCARAMRVTRAGRAALREVKS